MNLAADISQSSFWNRLGWAGFTFFLVKGLVWLAVPVVMCLVSVTGR